MKLDSTLAKKALEILSSRGNQLNLELVNVAEGVHPTTNEPLFLFSAISKGTVNEPARGLVTDKDGKPVELPPGSIRPIFTPVFVVPTEVTDPVRVKIDPTRNDLTLTECDNFRETVTVTLPKGSAVGKADVYFLADTTGSMGTILSSVTAGASSILSALAALGSDIQYGVGNYKDFMSGDPYAFQHQLSPTDDLTAVTAALNWTASGGGDLPEGQLFALDQIAQTGPVGWRPGAKRILVWFGDAAGHDPICPGVSTLTYKITEKSVTDKLVAEDIRVLAISTATSGGDLDSDPNLGASGYPASCVPAGTAGQATRITAATGGQHVKGINPSTIVAAILDLVKAALAIRNVRLVPTGTIAPFVTSITPAGYGPLPIDKEHVLKFNVAFAGGAVDCAKRAQVFTGSLAVVADGSAIARKPTVVTVPACKYIYAVKFVCGTQTDCDCGCSPVRPGLYATEINILNPGCKPATIEKKVIPLVLSGAVIGREPKSTVSRATDRIVLAAGAATMDDCCRLSELLLGATPSQPQPLNIGWLQITSSVELSVTAVYTATGSNGSLTADFATIQPILH